MNSGIACQVERRTSGGVRFSQNILWFICPAQRQAPQHGHVMCTDQSGKATQLLAADSRTSPIELQRWLQSYHAGHILLCLCLQIPISWCQSTKLCKSTSRRTELPLVSSVNHLTGGEYTPPGTFRSWCCIRSHTPGDACCDEAP